MRYRDFYNEMVEKRRKRLHFMKTKLPFIVVTVVILLAGLITLLLVSGNSYDYELGTINYGEKISSSPKSFLARGVYEYYYDGEYHEELPTTPGEYTYRVRSNTIFGQTKYSDEKTFVIDKYKAEIYCTSTQVIFGDNPIAAGVFASGDKLASYEFEYSNYYDSVCDIWVKSDSVVIKNSDGVDVTDNYDITYVKKEIEFLQCPISVKLKSGTFGYDGSKHSLTDFEVVGELIEGTHVEITTEEYVDANTYDTYINSARVVDSSGSEFVNYRVEYLHREKNEAKPVEEQEEPAKMTITPIALTATTTNDTTTFNGTNQYFDDYTINLDSVPDEIIPSGKYVSFADTYDYTVTLNFYRGTKDVSTNYVVTYNYGTITVNKASVKLKLNDVSVQYGTTTKKKVEYSIEEGDLFGLEANIDATIDGRYVGTYDLVASKCQIYKPDESDDTIIDYTNSFDIDIIKGSAEVTQAFLSFGFTYASYTYDGNNYTTDKAAISGKQYDDIITVQGEADCSAIGNSKIVLTDYTITDQEGNDIKANYSTPIYSGMVEVRQRSVIVRIDNYSVQYGDNVDESAITSKVTGGDGLLDGDSYTLTYEYDINDISAGITGSVNTVKDTLGKSRIDYYKFTVNKGNLSIIQRELTITVTGTSVEYTGAAIVFDESYITSSGLLTGDDITYSKLEGCLDISKVGTVESKLALKNITITNIAKDVDVTKYYNITINQGVFTVTKKKITITTASLELPYSVEFLVNARDDETSVFHQYVNSDLTIHNDVFTTNLSMIGVTINIKNTTVLKLSDETSVSNVVTYEDVEILDKDKNSIKENFEISFVYGVLSFKKGSD